MTLLEWATKSGAAIVEIDYEGELSGDGAHATSLLGLDFEGASDCVIHVGGFSRSLLPSLRLGFVVVPRSLIRPFARVRAASTRSSPHALQAALADFIEEGHWARHMRRLKQATRRRCDLVVSELRRVLPKGLAPRSPSGGAILTIDLPDHVDDVALAASLAAAGVDVLPLGVGAVGRRSISRGLVLGIGAHPESTLRRAAEQLATLVCEAL